MAILGHKSLFEAERYKRSFARKQASRDSSVLVVAMLAKKEEGMTNIHCQTLKKFDNPAAQLVEKKESKMKDGAPERIRTSAPFPRFVGADSGRRGRLSAFTHVHANSRECTKRGRGGFWTLVNRHEALCAGVALLLGCCYIVTGV
jgi:hypothetical protein